MERLDFGPDDDDGQDQVQSLIYCITPEDPDPLDLTDPTGSSDSQKEATDQ